MVKSMNIVLVALYQLRVGHTMDKIKYENKCNH